MERIISMGSKKIVVITAVCVLLSAALLTAVFAVFGAETAVVYLDERVTAETLEAFTATVTEKTSAYIADKTVTVIAGEERLTVNAADVATVDTEATVNAVSAVINNKKKGLHMPGEVVVNPVFTFNDDICKSIIGDFIKEKKIEKKIYTVDEEMKKVKIDISGEKTLVNIDKTADAVFDKIKSRDFTVCPLAYFSKLTAENTAYIYDLVCLPAVDAYVSYENGVKGEIVPERIGFAIDKMSLQAHLANGEQQFEVDITEILYPEITAEILAHKEMFSDVLSELSSRYSTGNVGRSQNISIAAGKINGIILSPGDVFSYNKAVGPRTYANGFKDAGVYTANGLENGVGGGICQVSSTLYGAQLMADLETVRRVNHSYTISYLPSGQDATVSYGAIDYQFKNSLKFPVKIECTVGGGVITVKILGIKTESYRKITLENSLISSTPPTVTEKPVSDLKPGKSRIKQSGQSGKTIDTYKLYWNGNTVEKRVLVHRSVYIPMPKIVEVGETAVPEEQPIPTQPAVPNDGGTATDKPTEPAIPNDSDTATDKPTEPAIPNDSGTATDKPTEPVAPETLTEHETEPPAEASTETLPYNNE